MAPKRFNPPSKKRGLISSYFRTVSRQWQLRELRAKKYNWINVCIFTLIITYIYYKVTFSAGDVWGLTISAVIMIFLWWCVSFGFSIATLSNRLLEALTPKSAAESLEMIGKYYGAGLVFFLLALYGPWFIFEEKIDVYGVPSSPLPTIEQSFELWSVEVTTFDYLAGDWDVYDTDKERLVYSMNSDQFKEREAVAFIARILVVAGMGIMAILNGIFLLLASRDLIGRGPAIKDLRNLKNIQDKLNLLWKKVTSLQEKNVSITGLIPLIEKIEKNIPAKVRLTTVLSRDQKFVRCKAAVSSTAIFMGLAAGLYFGVEWPDAMQEDTSIIGVCSVVGSHFHSEFQGFSGSVDMENKNDSWGGGWARTLVLFIEPLIMFGIFYNCREYLRLSEKQKREYFSLNSSTQDFEKPDFSRFFEEGDVHT